MQNNPWAFGKCDPTWAIRPILRRNRRLAPALTDVAFELECVVASSAVRIATALILVGVAQTSAQEAAQPTPDRTVPGGPVITRAEAVIGLPVRNGKGERLGTVDDLLISANWQVDNVLVSIGGFLGVGGRVVSIPLQEFRITADALVLPALNRERLDKLPAFEKARVPRRIDAATDQGGSRK